jgi:hypothetical protein
MRKSFLVMTAILLVTVLGQSSSAVQAQTNSSQVGMQNGQLSEMKAAILRTIGAKEPTVQLAMAGSVLTVTRVNSNLNESTHAGRDNEARAILGAISNLITGKPEFKSLTTIRVEYVFRSVIGGVNRVIDAIEFREDANGLFQFHRT